MSKRSKTHVEVYDLGKKRPYHKDKENVGEPLVELRFTIDLCNDCGTQALRSNNAQSSDHAANGEVDHHGLLSVARRNPERSECASKYDHAGVAQESRRDHELLH